MNILPKFGQNRPSSLEVTACWSCVTGIKAVSPGSLDPGTFGREGESLVALVEGDVIGMTLFRAFWKSRIKRNFLMEVIVFPYSFPLMSWVPDSTFFPFPSVTSYALTAGRAWLFQCGEKVIVGNIGLLVILFLTSAPGRTYVLQPRIYWTITTCAFILDVDICLCPCAFTIFVIIICASRLW